MRSFIPHDFNISLYVDSKSASLSFLFSADVFNDPEAVHAKWAQTELFLPPQVLLLLLLLQFLLLSLHCRIWHFRQWHLYPLIALRGNLKVTSDFSLFHTITWAIYKCCELNCGHISRIQLCWPAVTASPSLSMPVHAERVTFLKTLSAGTCMERTREQRWWTRGAGFQSPSYKEISSAFPLPAGSATGSWP